MDRRRFSVLAATLPLWPSLSSAGEPAALDMVLKAFDTEDGPGMAVQILRNGNVAYRRTSGLADIERRRTIDTRTCFRLASMTKAFTAMAVLQLVDRGQLRLDMTLPEIFSDFPKYGTSITILDLLQHTSGLPDFASLLPDTYAGQVRDNDVLQMMMSRQAGAFPPGERFEYSNSGYILLGLAVARVSGVPFGTFLRQNIFDPAGMTTAVIYDGETTPIVERAFGYSSRDGRYVRNDQSATSATQGDGGIYASLEDMAKWEAAIERGTLLSPKLQGLAFKSGRLRNGAETGYGFGWFVDKVNGHPRYWHGGGTVGFHNHYIRLPEKRLAIQVLMNHDDASAESAATRLVWQSAPVFRPKEPTVKRLTPEQLDAFEGYYDFRGTLTAIRNIEGKLAWIGLDAKPVILLPLDTDTFFYESRDINPDRNWRLRFDRQSSIRQISYMVDGRIVFTLPALGHLCSTLAAGQTADDDGNFIQRVESWLADDAGMAAPGISPPPGLAGKPIRILEKTAATAPVERSGHAVAAIYKFAVGAPADTRWLVVTADAAGVILSADMPEV